MNYEQVSYLLSTNIPVLHAGSEDNTVRLWDASGSCLATIEHPGCVWAVAFTPAGDLVSGCSDAVARIWSAAAERQVRVLPARGGFGVEYRVSKV
jgi:WD40 repeat protein